MSNVFCDVFDNRRTGDTVKPEKHRFLADKIEADPSLLEIPLANIARWLALGHSAAMQLEEWRTIILRAQASAAGMASLLALLRDMSFEAMYFKEFAPFPGVLSKEELEYFRCDSAH